MRRENRDDEDDDGGGGAGGDSVDSSLSAIIVRACSIVRHTESSVCVYICEQKMKMTTTTEKRKNQPTHIEIKLISKRFWTQTLPYFIALTKIYTHMFSQIIISNMYS